MDSKELRNLHEAYLDVYAPQENIDEATYSAKAARAGKDIGKPGKAFAKIAKEAGKRYGSKERGEKVAGAVLAKLRKQHEEVEIDEAVKGASRHDTEMRKAASTERKSGIKNRLSPAAGKDNADKMQRDVNYFDRLTKKNRNVVGLVTKEEVEQLDEISPEIVLAASKAADKKGKRAQASRLYKKFAARDQAANYAGYQRSSVKKEEVDIFDTILEYLIAEGYADTNESALVIMANMSEEWRQSIVEEMKPYPAEKVARKREAAKKKEDIANYQRKPDEVNKQYKRGIAMTFKKKMSDIGKG